MHNLSSGKTIQNKFHICNAKKELHYPVAHAMCHFVKGELFLVIVLD